MDFFPLIHFWVVLLGVISLGSLPLGSMVGPLIKQRLAVISLLAVFGTGALIFLEGLSSRAVRAVLTKISPAMILKAGDVGKDNTLGISALIGLSLLFSFKLFY